MDSFFDFVRRRAVENDPDFIRIRELSHQLLQRRERELADLKRRIAEEFAGVPPSDLAALAAEMADEMNALRALTVANGV